MNFQEAENAYKELRGQYSAGKTSSTDFENEVSKLKLQDADGRWWQIGVQSGDWYVHDGQKWNKARPPGEEAEEEAPAGSPEIPPIKQVSPPITPAPAAADEPAAAGPSTPADAPPPASAPAPSPQRPAGLPVRLSAAPPGRSGGLPVPLVVGIVVLVALVGIGILFAAYSFLTSQLDLSGSPIAQVSTPTSTLPTATVSFTGLVRTTPIPTIPPATETSLPVPTIAIVVTSTVPSTSITATLATATPKAVPSRTPTGKAKPTAASAATATPALAPGVYVTKLQMDPPQPNFNEPVGFRVTLLNTTGTLQTYRWLVKIFQCRASPCVGDDFKRSIGESTVVESNIPPGSSAVAAPKHWSTGLGACTYVAMPHYLDPASQAVTPFLKTDGKPMYFVFSMCH